MSRKNPAANASHQTTYARRKLDREMSKLYNVRSSIDPNITLKEITKMSKTQTTATEAPKPETLEVKVKAVNIETKKRSVETGKTEFTPAADYATAVQRLNDEAALTELINAELRRRAIAAAKSSVLSEKFVSLKSALTILNSWRNGKKYAAMVTVEKGKPGWKEQYSKQTDALLNDGLSNDFMLELIRSSQETETDDADDNTEE